MNETPEIPSEPAHPKWLADPDGEGRNEESAERLDDLREQVEIIEGAGV